MSDFDAMNDHQATPAPRLSSEASEQAILSILAHFPGVYDDVGDRLSDECFAIDENRRIFQVVKKQILARRGMDIVSILQDLATELDPSYLHGVLASNEFSARGVNRHVDTLVDLHKSRQLHALSFTLSELAHGEGPASTESIRRV
jgi:replicative DNA helicase